MAMAPTAVPDDGRSSLSSEADERWSALCLW
eukprot:CAMPEP_0185553490 /NCGR_PEP_ID=MMETSP1381-20130426/38084_1 /TAXON_ID=298111 /ORGANISM="Pavlova sp., Strain CCMP459" /LENGTH=30 /DNA_ID= /DNA_START= /DNA_END= /DNA_ORIENTATION=